MPTFAETVSTCDPVQLLLRAEEQAPTNQKKCSKCGHFENIRNRKCGNCWAQLPKAEEARKASADTKRQVLGDITAAQANRAKFVWVAQSAKYNRFVFVLRPQRTLMLSCAIARLARLAGRVPHPHQLCVHRRCFGCPRHSMDHHPAKMQLRRCLGYQLLLSHRLLPHRQRP
jgi:hypothetical protein